MRIGDRCFVHGYVDEIRKDTVIIRNKGGYFGTDPGEVIVVNDTAHPNWIPVTERLPEPRIDVWCDSDLGQMVGYYEKNVETWYGRDYLELKVIAWMPLPEPYREVSE